MFEEGCWLTSLRRMLRSFLLPVRNTTETTASAWDVTALECAARRLCVHWKCDARYSGRRTRSQGSSRLHAVSNYDTTTPFHPFHPPSTNLIPIPENNLRICP